MRFAAIIFLTAAVILAVNRPCPYEDSTFCTWDAESQGNGTGRSFVNVGVTIWN